MHLTLLLLPMSSNGASCWICLEEGPNEAGEPLRRECSCRGNAGFAHLSCLITFGEEKSKQAAKSKTAEYTDVFYEHWEKCPNCTQQYRCALARDLSTAFVSFAEKTYSNEGNVFPDDVSDNMWVLTALQRKLESTTNVGIPQTDNDSVLWDDLLDEGVLYAQKQLSKIKQMMTTFKMNSWVHAPPGTQEYETYKLIRSSYETNAYFHLSGYLHMKDVITGDGEKKAIDCLRKAIAIYKLLRLDSDAERMNRNIERIKSSYGMSGDIETDLKILRESYEHRIAKYGEEGEPTIRTGIALGEKLHSAQHYIEAERLLTMITAISHRVHGPAHSITLEAKDLLDQLRVRPVAVDHMSHSDDEIDLKSYNALRYENDGELIALKGPITWPQTSLASRHMEEKEGGMTTVKSSSVFPHISCPVICHGLKQASHLNGKIGDIRKPLKQCGEDLRYEVNFEDEKLKPALVKVQNLRVVFDLPALEGVKMAKTSVAREILCRMPNDENTPNGAVGKKKKPQKKAA